MRGGLLLVTAAVIGSLAGWTKRVRATDHVAAPDARLVARRIGSLADQLDAARGRVDLLKLQLDRANAIMASSAKYQIPADLAASIYDIALSEGIDPALGFQLVKIESSFKANARSSMGAIGYTQLQVATARFYEPGVTERELYRPRAQPADRVPLPERSAGQVRPRHPPGAAGLQPRPGQGGDILAQGGDPTNGYSDAVLRRVPAPGASGPGWR